MLYVRKGVDGNDEVLVDVNTLAKDGTVALDWWVPSHDGKYVAYGTSEGGSEISTLHIIETATHKLLPDTIERTRAASLAWKPDDSGFYYTRYPKPGEVAAGQEMYNRHVFYHPLGGDPAKDPLIFGEGRDPQDWPNVTLSNDGRWLGIMVEQGWTQERGLPQGPAIEYAAAAHHQRQRVSLLRADLRRRALHPDQRRQPALSRLQGAGRPRPRASTGAKSFRSPMPC